MRMVILGLGLVFVLVSAPAAFAAPENYAARSIELVRAGDIAAGQGSWDDAILFYERAITASPKNVDAYYKMGQAYERLERPGRALKFYRSALSIDSNHVKSLSAQALALLKKDDVEKAEAALTKIKRICGAAGCEETATVNEAIKEYLAAAVTSSDDKPSKN